MHRCASAIILGYKIRVGLHDFGELFRVTQTDCAVKSNGRILGNRGIPAKEQYSSHLSVSAAMTDVQIMR